MRYWIQHALRWACARTGSSSPRWPPVVHAYLIEEDAQRHYVIIMKAGLIEMAARIAGGSRTVPLPRWRGAAAAVGGSSSWGEAGGLPQSQGGIWRCLMRCKVGGLDHDPPSALRYYIPPTFITINILINNRNTNNNTNSNNSNNDNYKHFK